MRRNRRAKIVATLGPASSDAATIRRLFEAGVDVFRLNFSHGSKEDHARRYEIIRGIERDLGRPIAVLQDLQGPKIRIGTLAGGKAMLQNGTVVRFDSDKQPGDQARLPLLHPEVYQAIAPGHQVLINDGRVRLEVIGCGPTHFDARVVVGGEVSDRKGVNLPDTLLQLSPITAKDRADLEFGLSLGVDFVALSFVQQPSDVIEGRSLVGDKAQLMVKIEKPAALKRIKEIVQLADAVMVARGDLGVEIPAEDVPGWQKDIVRECRMAGKPVIIATQMLESMVQSPTPTRAEASDVATGVYDGADAVMLSAESASGAYPVEAVAMMDRIISHTENHGAYRSIIDALEPEHRGHRVARGVGRGRRDRRPPRRGGHGGLHLQRQHRRAPGAAALARADRRRDAQRADGAPARPAVGRAQRQVGGDRQLPRDGREGLWSRHQRRLCQARRLRGGARRRAVRPGRHHQQHPRHLGDLGAGSEPHSARRFTLRRGVGVTVCLCVPSHRSAP